MTSQQDNGAIEAMNSLSSVTVIYHSNDSSSGSSFVSNAGKGVSKLVSGLFRKNDNGDEGDGGGIGQSSVSQFDNDDDEAHQNRISIVDTLRGPALSIEYTDDNKSTSTEIKTKTKTRNIALKRIGEITPNDSFLSSSSGISIYTKKKHRNDESHELCRIDLYDSSTSTSSTLNPVGSEERDDIINSIKLLIQWDMDRRSKNGNQDEEEEDDDEDDTHSKKQGLGQRAIKMKHFAEREIELSKQRKDRESRKARYLKDSGGLKYTALAMANRQMT
jgi:hypothetical protein